MYDFDYQEGYTTPTPTATEGISAIPFDNTGDDIDSSIQTAIFGRPAGERIQSVSFNDKTKTLTYISYGVPAKESLQLMLNEYRKASTVDIFRVLILQGEMVANNILKMNHMGFQLGDSVLVNGQCLRVWTKHLNLKQESHTPPTPAPKPVTPLTPTEQAQQYRDIGMAIPQYLQRDLALEKAEQERIANDPYRKLSELNAEIARLEALAQGTT